MTTLILGSKGFIGSNLCKYLKKKGYKFVSDQGKKKSNFLIYNNIKSLIDNSKPQIIVNCLGVVGGIQWGLNNKVKIFEENNLLSINLLKSIKNKNVVLINLLANCIYPFKYNKFNEKNILNGPVHPSVYEYGMSRRLLFSATKLYSEENLMKYINLIPSNVYGPGDHFDPHRSHALGGLISKFKKASENNIDEIEIWGTGNPKRDWLFVYDLCEIIYKTIINRKKLYSKTFNVSSGDVISIKKLAFTISKQFKYKGKLFFNKRYPDGDLIKSFDKTLFNKQLGFYKFTDIDRGINKTINFLKTNEIKI